MLDLVKLESSCLILYQNKFISIKDLLHIPDLIFDNELANYVFVFALYYEIGFIAVNTFSMTFFMVSTLYHWTLTVLLTRCLF